MIDPLENCEVGNNADGGCCSARCRLDPAGTACTSDGNDCTDDVCNATGTCTGSPAPAGQACNDDFDPCTSDVCGAGDAAGTCTHVPVPPAACRRATACHSTCTEQLAACKRTCPEGGQARRDCRAACAERSTCIAPGAHIHTLAYVTTECTTDPQQRSSLKQTLFVRHGNCDPVSVAAFGPSRPVTTQFADTCIYYGVSRSGWYFHSDVGRSVGVFQNLGVLRDGSTVFNLTKQFSNVPALTPDVPEEGLFVVRADGSELRRLGPPSRAPQLFSFRWSVSPDGRTIAFIDLGEPNEPPSMKRRKSSSSTRAGTGASNSLTNHGART